MSCPIQRFLYCFTVPTLTLCYIRVYIHIYTIKSQLASHTIRQRLYIECTKFSEGQVPMDLWSDGSLKSHLSWQTQKSLSFAWIIFSCFLVMHSLTSHFLLLHINWLSSFLGLPYGLCKSFITTESSNFLRFKEKKKWDSWVKSCRGKTTTKDYFYYSSPNKEKVINPYTWQYCSSSKDRDNMHAFHIDTLQILFLAYCCMILVRSQGTHGCSL